MAVDKPINIKAANIASPSPIVSFDGGLDERGDYNIAPNCFSYGRNIMVNSSGNATKRLVKKKWLPDSVGFNGEAGKVYLNKQIYYFIADDGKVKWTQENKTEWYNCGGSNDITTTNNLVTTFLRVGNWLMCMNGTDTLRYIDLDTMAFDMVKFTSVVDPVNTLTVARTGLTSGGVNVYYAITYNSDGGGETKLSNILNVPINKSRSTWKNDGTEYVTLTFNDTPPAGAKTRNLYISVALQGATPVAGDMFLLQANIPISSTTAVDNGSSPITLSPAPTINTTAGGKFSSGLMADNTPVLYGSPDEPHTIVFPTIIEGGGISFGGDAQSLRLLEGTNYYPTSVVGFRNNQNIPTLLTLFSGTDGVSKQQTISQKTLSYGNNILTYWGADDLNSGASAVYAPHGVVGYLNQLLFPSSEGITSIKTEADLQNVLSPSIISEPVGKTYKTIKSADFSKIVADAWDGLILFAVPSRGYSYNNQIIVYDLTNRQKPKWYIWDIPVDWLGVVSPPDRDSFVYIRQNNHFFKLVEGYVAEDEDHNGIATPFPMTLESAFIPFNQQRNSFFSMSQVVCSVAEFIGEYSVKVSYYNQKNKLKSKTKTFKHGTSARNLMAGWSNPRLLYRSWGNRVIGWGTPIPTSNSANANQKTRKRHKIRTPNPLINEYKITITTNLSNTSLDVLGIAPEGVNIGVIADMI